jgi:O-antigen ligase
LLFIIIPSILNIGFLTYNHSKVGSVGWFLSANSVGNILSLLMPIIIIYIFRKKEKFLFKGFLIIITLYTFFSMGIKTPILSLAICLLINLIYYLIMVIKNRKGNQIIATFSCLFIVVIIGIFLIPKTSFYKNIEIHREYLGFNNYYEMLTDFQLLDHFIFSQRLTFLNNTYDRYENAIITEKLIGIGYSKNYKADKMIEIDYYDILYRHGIIGFLLYLSLFFTIIIKCLNKIIKNFNFENIQYLSIVLLILLISLFSGHVLIVPSVSIFVALLLSFIQKEACK